MASKDSLQIRELNKKGVVGHVVTDTPVGIRIIHTAPGVAVTSVTTTAATGIILIDADGTTTITFAASTTMAAVAAAISAATNWEAIVLDALGSLASDDNLVGEAITASTVEGVTVWDANVDTSVALQLAYRLSKNRVPGTNKPKGSTVIDLKEIKYSVNMGTAAVDSVQIWSISPAGVETQLQGILSVDTTATTINWASGQSFLSGGDGHDIVVLIKDAATLADAAGNYLDVMGEIK
ncbi:hypothetical protein KAR91_81120 [Candidatus Pacearchaeota archaeon]|nr:hypothetical protein [Candidatus Pacearchaeota archaeon]